MEAAVERGEDARALRSPRAQQQRAKRGRERERIQRGDRDRAGDRERELLIQPPGGPRHERDGQEHRHQHQRDGDDRPRDLAHRGLGRCLRRELLLLHQSLDVLDDDDRVVDDEPDREHEAEQRERVDREPERLHQREGSDQRDGHRDGGDQRGAKALEEHEDDEEDQQHGLDERREHLLHGFRDEERGVVDDRVLHAGREALRQALHLGAHGLRDVERVRRRQRVDADARRLQPPELGETPVALGAELDACDVLQAQYRAVGARAHHDLLELLHGGEAAPGGERVLELLALGRGRLPDRARGHLLVLLAQHADHVLRVDPELRQLGGQQPDAHRVAPLTELRHLADAGQALEPIRDVDPGVVAEEEIVARAVGRDQVDDQREVGRLLRHAHALALHLLRELRLGDLHAVLDVDGGDVQVVADLERDRGAHAAVVRAVRGHVHHALDAVDLLLDRDGDGALDHLRARAGVAGRDLHGGRGDRRKLRDREQRNADGARERDQDREHGREDGAIDEEVDHAPPRAGVSAARASGSSRSAPWAGPPRTRRCADTCRRRASPCTRR